MIINKSKYILDKTDPPEMKKYIMPATEIKELKLQWQGRLKEQQTKDFSEKEKCSLHQESQKYSLLGLKSDMNQICANDFHVTKTKSFSFSVKKKPTQPRKRELFTKSDFSFLQCKVLQTDHHQ